MEKKFYDDGAFYVNETKYGIWHSFDKDDKPLITSLNEEECVKTSRFYLKSKQDGTLNNTEVTYNSVVDGKL